MGRKGKRGHGGPKGKGQSGGSREKKKADNPVDDSVVAKGKGGKTSPVHGLSNLGNTCFFNAVMQCMGQSHYFRARLEAHIQSPNFTYQLKLPTQTDGDGHEDNEIYRTVSVQEKPGELTMKLNTFLSAMGEGGGGTLNPKPVFSEICRKAPRFSGYHQQDSQELLRYLLDSLRSEEIYRIKKALLLTYKVNSGNAKVTEEDRREIRLYGIQAQLAETFVDDVFGGRLMSTVVCLECGNCSTIHETFLDLSLPIADDKGVSQQKDHKRNKKPAAIASRSVASQDADRETSPPPPSPPLPTEKTTVSKHQSKKARKQQEKAAKKQAKLQAKKKQSLKLHELLNTPSKENEQSQSEVKEGGEGEETAKMEEGEPASQEMKREGEGETSVSGLVGGRDTELAETNGQETKVEGDNMNIDDSANHNSTGPTADVSTFPSKEDQNIDPATGECKVVAMDTEEQGDSTEANDTAERDDVFQHYASAGPLPDQRDRLPHEQDLPDQRDTNVTNYPTAEKEEVEGEEGGEKNTEMTGVQQGDISPNEKDSEITDLLGAITLDEQGSPLDPTAGVMGEEKSGGEKREESEQPTASLSVDLNTISTDAVLERLKVQTDSVEGSLKRFCTPELLTGSNKFACAVCTKEKAGRETAMEQEEGKRDTEEGERGENEDVASIERKKGEGEGGNDQTKENIHHKSKEEAESDGHQEATTAEEEAVVNNTPSEAEQEGGGSEDSGASPQSSSSEGEDEHCHCGSNVSQLLPSEEPLPSSALQDDPSASTAQEEEEGLLPGDGQDDLPLLGEKDSKDGEEETSVKEQDKGEIVFSDAKKQFLMESLPLILTLNLKRFVQHGRRLQKNSRHISFPTLLDMAPFSTDTCKVGRCDSKGQLLYSLYGVVEHSGGMQGGHYTAYVRTRTPIKLSSCKTTAKHHHEQTAPSQEQRPPPNDDGFQLAGGEVASERNEGASVVGGSDFDVSSTAGQWYYISDSRVRTATESEVLKSQAYLLFYEQLPLLSP